MSGQSIRLKTFSISSPTWFPATQSVSGIVSSSDVLITGTSTTFTSQISAGDWLVNISTNEAHKVMNVISDTQLELESAFTAPLSGSTVAKIKDKTVKYLYAVFITASGTIRGVTQSSSSAWPVNIPWPSPSYDDFMEPILITPGGGGTVSVIQGE